MCFARSSLAIGKYCSVIAGHNILSHWLPCDLVHTDLLRIWVKYSIKDESLEFRLPVVHGNLRLVYIGNRL
jgi:hypothetical protein